MCNYVNATTQLGDNSSQVHSATRVMLMWEEQSVEPPTGTRAGKSNIYLMDFYWKTIDLVINRS